MKIALKLGLLLVVLLGNLEINLSNQSIKITINNIAFATDSDDSENNADDDIEVIHISGSRLPSFGGLPPVGGTWGSGNDPSDGTYGNQQMCPSGKTREEIHTAYISTTEFLDQVEGDALTAVVLDTAMLGTALRGLGWPPKLVTMAQALYGGLGSIMIKYYVDATKDRIKQDYEAEIAACP